jgi:hypothetical protein
VRLELAFGYRFTSGGHSHDPLIYDWEVQEAYRLEGRERVFEKRALLHLPYLLSHRAIGGIGILGGFDGELDAIRVWLEDPQAAVRGTVVGIELLSEGAMNGCQSRTLASSLSVSRSRSRIEASSTR